jgi:hypothetical protein
MGAQKLDFVALGALNHRLDELCKPREWRRIELELCGVHTKPGNTRPIPAFAKRSRDIAK